MKYSRFEDLPVWQAALDLGVRIQILTGDAVFEKVQGRRGGDLTDQLRRASLSISNNIAEGFERGTTSELLAYLYISRGSAGETRSMLHFALRLPALAGVHSQISELLPLAESCSRQLRGWMDSLQNSDIKGQRHLNDAVREEFLAKRRKDAFLPKLEQLNGHLRGPFGEGGDK
ncbi:MAG TPA: four helix bundle protein [Phycisphaerae bacterium]|nr:four helix bundle protein [Phycisphaerae bacterium]